MLTMTSFDRGDIVLFHSKANIILSNFKFKTFKKKYLYTLLNELLRMILMHLIFRRFYKHNSQPQANKNISLLTISIIQKL